MNFKMKHAVKSILEALGSKLESRSSIMEGGITRNGMLYPYFSKGKKTPYVITLFSLNKS